jgi:uncharacterized protein (TIGR02145 family)/uncharacterized repeat protein (TIGR02543 family)
MSNNAVVRKKNLGIVMCMSIFFFVTCYDLPVDPHVPENAYCQLLLKNSSNDIEQAYIEDTAGTVIGVGADVKYPDFIDSIRINFVDAASEIVKTEKLIVNNSTNRMDTVWTYFTYPQKGKIKVNSVAYIQKSILYRDSATILFSIEQPNRKPQIRYTGSNSITYNDTCKLYITVSDQNPNQGHLVSAIKKPLRSLFENNVFIWKPDSNFTGVEQLVLVAVDNGKPALADTLTIMIGVRSPSMVAKLSVATFTKDSVTIAWQAIDSAKLYYVYKSNTQIGNFNLYDSTINTIYTDSLSSTNSYYYIDAINNSNQVIWKSDTLVSSIQLATDMTSPQVLLPASIKDSMIINSSVFSLPMKISDSSGVGAVLCSLETKGVTVIKENDSIYNLTVTDLKPYVFSTIVVTAEDLSFRRNVTRFVLSVKFNPGLLDTTAPVVKLLNVQSDTVVVSRDTAELQFLCKDSMGITSVVCSLGAKAATVSKINDSVYTAVLTGLEPGKVNSGIIKASDLSGNITLLKYYVKFDATKSDIIPPVLLVAKITETDHPDGEDSITVSLLCNDVSGIGSLTGMRGSKAVIVTKVNDSLYSSLITMLKAGKDDTVTFTATDNSFNKNTTQLAVVLKYKPVYGIIYDGNGKTGGVVPADINKYAKGTVVTVKGNSGMLVRDGFTFAGWNAKADGSGTAYKGGDEFVMPDTAVTLFATWNTEKVLYLFSYDANGAVSGTVPSDPVKYASGEKVAIKGNSGLLAKTGYVFSGWSTTADGSGVVYTTGTEITVETSAVILYALWKAAVYNVTFSSELATDGLTSKVLSVTYPVETIAELPVSVRAGYTFSGWWTGDNGAGVQFTNQTKVVKDITVYAKWTVIASFTVLYNNNGSTSGTVPIDPMTYISGVPVTVKENSGALVKSGYTLDGWTTTLDGTGIVYKPGETILMPSANVMLYAKWSPVSYTVSFANGTDIKKIQVIYPSVTVATLPLPVKTGFTFGGWWTGENGTGTEFKSSTEVTFSQVVYAKWTPVSYSVTFSSLLATDGIKTQVVTVDYPAVTVKTLPVSSRSGYLFGGWYTKENGEGTAFTTATVVTSDITVYAMWTVVPGFTITYNGNANTSGTVPVDAVTYLDGNIVTVKGNTSSLLKTGYNFGGWNTKADGTGTKYAAGSELKIANANVILYAQWNTYSYTVTFSSTDATVPASPLSMPVASPNVSTGKLPTAPSKTNYSFSGWNTKADGSGTAFVASTTVSSNITVYAIFAPISYTVTYSCPDATSDPKTFTQKVTYPATKVSALPSPAPTRTGYEFGGWWTSLTSGGVQFTTATVVSANVSLVAKWNQVFTVTFSCPDATSDPKTFTRKVTAPATTVTDIPVAVKTGNVFTGWYYTNAQKALVKFTNTTPVTSNMEVTAKWGCVDVEGNVYKTVTIGKQTWMAENFKSTHYNDGTPITFFTNSATWNTATTGLISYTNNANTTEYGYFYNWYVVNSGLIAPPGWHIPTKAEFDELLTYLSQNGFNSDGTTTVNRVAAALASQSVSWGKSSTAGAPGNNAVKNNASGFNGEPIGIRNESGTFDGVGSFSWFWCADDLGNGKVESLMLHNDFAFAYYASPSRSKTFGCSVRFVMDN